MNDAIVQYFRCPDRYIRFELKGAPSETNGYFCVGNAICYGRYNGHPVSEAPAGTLRDALSDIEVRNGNIYLPFDPSQVADNLRSEKYAGDWQHTSPTSVLAKLYYFVRPLLPVGARRIFQRFHLRGWDRLPFPSWPVDSSVDNLLEHLFLLSVRSSPAGRIPFIWFWPGRASACAVMTHDVETEAGRSFCPTLMDIDDSFGIKASLQIIPEERYVVTKEFLASILERGFEVVVHDLNHDGHLYRDRQQFLDRVAKINAYGEEYRAEGFRAGILYRRQLWYDALKFSYDMSVPNVAHLDPQRGGCCTVMPYFLGHILELPVTATQDYTLFNILKDFSIDLWKQQIDLIMGKHGLINFIVHPDYILQAKQQNVYKELLRHLVRLRDEKDVWMPTPGEVNRWWRQRAELRLVESGETWRIEGPGKERASIAWASEKEGRLVFAFQESGEREFQLRSRSN